MYNLVDLLFAGLSGLFLGASIMIGIYIILVKRAAKKLKVMEQEFIKKLNAAKTSETVTRKLLSEASDLAAKQNDIIQSLQQPSKNALHSRYKGQLIAEWKKLEEEKLTVLQKILDAGFDPEIAFMDPQTNEMKGQKLSEFVAESRALNPFAQEEAKMEAKTKKLKSLYRVPTTAQTEDKKDEPGSSTYNTKNGTWTVYNNDDDKKIH